jgi:hypothetical protein
MPVLGFDIPIHLSYTSPALRGTAWTDVHRKA